jgi:hypothetical protein
VVTVTMMMIMRTRRLRRLRNADHAFDAADNATDDAAHDSADHGADRTGSLPTNGCAMPATADDSILGMRGCDRRYKRGNDGGRHQLNLHGYFPLSDIIR